MVPPGLNNRATVSRANQSVRMVGCSEIIGTYTPRPDSKAGDVFINERISVDSCARLSTQASLFQRVFWQRVSLKLIALNPSTVKAGYNVGYVEDPLIDVPALSSDVLPFLTGLRGTEVRQNWNQSDAGIIMARQFLPEMYTTEGGDPRRFFIGRVVAACTGPPGPDVVFQLQLEYTVTFAVPAVRQRIIQPSGFVMSGDLVPARPGLKNGPGDPAALTAEVNPIPVQSIAPLPPPGQYEVAPGGFCTVTSIDTLDFPVNPDGSMWQLHDAIINAITTQKIHSISVPEGAGSWANVSYRTTPGGPLNLFPKGNIEVTPIVDAFQFKALGRCALPEFAVYPSWTQDDWKDQRFPGNWLQAPIIPQGTIFSKLSTSSNDDRQAELERQLEALQASVKTIKLKQVTTTT